jgi:hypothetical protein
MLLKERKNSSIGNNYTISHVTRSITECNYIEMTSCLMNKQVRFSSVKLKSYSMRFRSDHAVACWPDMLNATKGSHDYSKQHQDSLGTEGQQRWSEIRGGEHKTLDFSLLIVKKTRRKEEVKMFCLRQI